MKISGFIYSLLLSCCILASFSSLAQAVPDTFERWINRVSDDSLRLLRATQVTKYYDNIDSATSWKYFLIARKIADSTNTLISRITILELEGIFYTKRKPAYAYGLYKQAIALIPPSDTSRFMKTYEASLNNNLGVISYLNGDYEGAIQSFIESVSIYETHGDPGNNLPPTLNNIASTYGELEYFSKALEYSRQAVVQAEKKAATDVPAVSYIGLANSFINIGKYDSGFLVLQKAMTLSVRNNNQYDIFLCYSNLGSYFEKKLNYDSALWYYKKTLPISIAINSPFDNVSARLRMAQMQIQLKETDAAKRQIDTIEIITRQYGFNDLDKDLYHLKSEYYRNTGNLATALDYREKFESLKDSLFTDKRLKRIDFLAEKYESDKKQIAITDLEKQKKIQQLDIRQKSILNYFLIAGLAVFVLVGYLIYRNLRHKQLLSKQTEQLHARRIKELEQEKQLISMNSLLKGQEEERGRLAKDLHDGLGGMLSGVKLSLGAMKGNLILTEDNARLFSKALSQLDNSIGEMRRVAHNMMPEALVRLGLQQAIQDYCDGLSESQSLTINCQFHGLDNRLDAPSEIVVYRIVQELLNNVVKHSQATEVLVQIMRHENNLNITVEDNGRGFSVDEASYIKGAGLGNIRTRVDYLKGNLDIQSSPGKGTSVHIDCVIENS